jgi:hypothetical protein
MTARLGFDQLHTLNDHISRGTPGTTFLTIMRLRDGKFQHLQRKDPINIQVHQDLSLTVQSNTVQVNGKPSEFIEVFSQCTPYKMEALQKPTVVQDLAFNFVRLKAISERFSLGLGDFIVIFKRGHIPDTIVFLTDLSMQMAWPAATIAQVFPAFVGTFFQNTPDFRINYGLYCSYVKRHIDDSFVWWEYMPTVCRGEY